MTNAGVRTETPTPLTLAVPRPCDRQLNELRVDLADFPRQRPGFDDYPGSNATARYGAFALGSETEGYPLKVLDHYSGDAGTYRGAPAGHGL